MELEGRRMIVALAPLHSKAMFPELPQPGAVALGEVVGETPGVGLWFRPIMIFKEYYVRVDPARTLLLKWEWIEYARVLEPDAAQTVETAVEEIEKELGFRAKQR
jgi:hypothetical protein